MNLLWKPGRGKTAALGGERDCRIWEPLRLRGLEKCGGAKARAIVGTPGWRTLVTVVLGSTLLGVAQAAPNRQGGIAASGTAGTNSEVIILPESVPDPIEPFNRVVYSLNVGIMAGVVKPTAKVYRRIVVRPVRKSIADFSRNLTYPGRLVNNLLQGKWNGARDETYRFLCNTTLGLGGFSDVASQFRIPTSDADFGQTFGKWGWKPACYLMLPILGPSNERDTVGMALDKAAEPLVYIGSYDFEIENPLTYAGPYTYFNYASAYNTLSDNVEEYVRFSRSEMDPYSLIQYAWSFSRDIQEPDFRFKENQDTASLETIESVFFSYKNPEFPGRAKTRSVLIPSTGGKLEYSFWLQPKTAPVVYIIPGLGSHRLAKSCVALAELAFQHGYSVVCLSSAFHSEFMEHASTAAMPAFLPTDGRDVHVALSHIDGQLRTIYPGRLGERALVGYSMGGLHSLFVAATQAGSSTNKVPLVVFDRIVGISPPVRLLHGIEKLDEYYRAPLAWPAGERTQNLENTFLKVAALSKVTPTTKTRLPLSEIESKFLVGLTFRFILRDIIYSSQRRNNQGILHRPIKNLRRTAVYNEILEYSYRDYFEKFAIPYYRSLGSPGETAEQMETAGDLRTYEASLRANPKLRILVNQNDFLLSSDDLAWLRATFSPDQLRVFEQGGHLGNLSSPDMQKAILDSLSGLKATLTPP